MLRRGLRLDLSVTRVTVAGSVLIAVFVALGDHPVAQQVTYDLAGLAFLALLLVGLDRHIVHRSWAWRALYAGIACDLAGDIVGGSSAIPSPSRFTHGLYLASFPLIIAGLIGSMKRRRLVGEGPLPQLLDSAIVFVSGFALLWFAWLDKPWDARGLSAILTVAYPVLDWLVVALLLRFVFTPGRWPPALRLLLSAAGLMFLGDIAAESGIASKATMHVWAGVASLVAFLLWALVGLHPSVAEIEGFSAETVAGPGRLHRRRLVLLLLSALVPGSLILLTHGVSGSARRPEDMIALLLVVGGVPLLTVARLGDLLRTLRRSVEEAEAAHADLDAVIDASPVPICVTDHEASVLIWNQAAEDSSGYSADEVIGGPPPIVPAEDPERIAALYEAALAGSVQRGVEIKLLDRQEQQIDVRFSTAPLGAGRRGIVVLFEDVTEQKQTAERIEFLASHDPFTGLPNRRSFEHELALAVARAPRGSRAALLLCDIDNFKLVNDTAGHPVGDRLLIEVAGRLRAQLRPGDALCRLSGDEFAVLLNGSDEEQAAAAAERLLEVVRDYRLESRVGVLDVSISLGLYELRKDETTQRALRRADEALYEAKAHGKDQQRAWKPGNVAILTASRGWSPRIKDALRDDRIEAFLQPIVSLSSGRVAFYEALCRLKRVDGSYIAPAAFIGHAERFGLMSAIDGRMVDLAHQLLTERDDLKILVNLSASSFDDDNLLDHLRAVLATVPAGSLGIEITEHVAMTNLAHATSELHTLKELGALVAIDDFGTGFSSFEHLRRLPADFVKVGNGFIEGLGTDPVNDAILDGIVATAGALSMRVIAEGVETRATAALLQARKIPYAQGYLYARPLPADEVLEAEAEAEAEAESAAAAHVLRARGPRPQQRPSRSPSEA